MPTDRRLHLGALGLMFLLSLLCQPTQPLGAKVEKNKKHSNPGSSSNRKSSMSTPPAARIRAPTASSTTASVASATAASGVGGKKDEVASASTDYYTGDSANVSRLLDSLLKGYDKRLRPNYNGHPVEVGITMFISSVSSISEVNMDYTLDFYFRQHWHDPRLNFTEEEDELCISNEMLARIWWPDTFFANAKKADFHTATTHNAFLRIKPSGWITLSLRLTVTSMCPMDLTFFPMDTQICSLEIESYAYSDKHIAYAWKEGPRDSVGIDRTVQLPQFSIKGYRTKNKLEVLTTGNYSRLACQFYFVRSLGYYVIHIYIPSCLIVVLSWISFWLHRDASPARVSLGITTVLTMTTLIFSSNASLPKISYLKIIDIYLVTCFVMVFTSLLEYACVSYLGNRKPKKSTSDPDVEDGVVGNRMKNRQMRVRGVNGVRRSSIRPYRISVKNFGIRSLLYTRSCVNEEVRYVNSTNAQSSDARLSKSSCSALPAARQCPAHACEKMSLRGSKPNKVKVKVNRNIVLACAIDKYSRAIFPIIFLMFNIAYWVILPNISPAPEKTDFDFIN